MALILNGDTGVTYPVIAGGTSALQSSAGKVLQVVQAVKTDTFSTSSSTLADITGLSVTITPSSSSNKILVLVDLHIGYNVYAGIVHLLRGATKIYAGDGGLNRCGLYSNIYQTDGLPQYSMIPVTGTFLDSPATTSALTYKIQMLTSSSTTVYINRRNVDTYFGASCTLTVMEIAA